VQDIERWIRAQPSVLLDVPGKPKLHHLRDTYASAAIAAGVEVWYLSRQLGHEDASFTHRTHVDLFEARDKAEASRNLLKASGFTGLT
jgi:integrase